MGKRGSIFLAAGMVLLAGIICTGIVAAAPVMVFSDNFDDNTLDTAKWNEDVFGTNNAFAEDNGRAEFQTYGNYDSESGWHAYLNSTPIVINNWETIEITGNWTNNGYSSRTHIATVTDLNNPSNVISVEYNAANYEMWYYWETIQSDHDLTSVPSPDLVPYRLKITRTGFEYYEYDVLKKSIATASMAGTSRFQLQVGAWDLSPFITNTYIDDIEIRYTPTIPAVVTISPDPLSLKSRSGKNAVTVLIELPGADVTTVDPSSIILSYGGQHIAALPGPMMIRDQDRDGIPDLMVKFDRKAVAGIVVPGNAVPLVVSGTVGGNLFSGTDTIRVTG